MGVGALRAVAILREMGLALARMEEAIKRLLRNFKELKRAIKIVRLYLTLSETEMELMRYSRGSTLARVL